MNSILRQAKEIEPQILKHRHWLHRHPEAGFNLPVTAAYVTEQLQAMGIEPKLCGGPIESSLVENFAKAGFPHMDRSTGITATIGSGSPCILLRADMDALPMDETAGLVDFPSENPGLSHMCGHDSHTAMLLGAAQILKSMEDSLCGTVKLMFQTGEECGCGSKFMVERGILENPKVDAAFALHVMSQEEAGTVSYTAGIASAAMDTYMVKILGKGGHSSTPQNAIDPLMIANQLYTTLNLLSTREIDPRETVALTVGKCGGGTMVNIIPDTAELMVAFRTFNRQVRDHLNLRVPEIIDHTVKMWRGDYTVTDFHTPSTFTDEAFCKELEPFIMEIVGEGNVSAAPCMAGTEDFGYITEKVPSMFAILGAGGPDNAPMHNPNMVLDENVFHLGTAMLAGCAVKWLEKHKEK